MAAGVLWAVSTSQAAAAAGPASILLTTAQVAGDCIYICERLGANASAVASTPTDTAGNTYVALAAQTTNGTLHMRWWRAVNVAAQSASANTVTCAFTGGNSSWQIAVLGVGGMATGATPEDLVFGADQGSGVTPLVGAESTSNTGLLLAGYATNTTAVTWSAPLDNAAGNAMTFQIPPSGTFRLAVVSLTGEAAASYSPRITKSQSEAWIASAVLVKDPVASGTTATIASTLPGPSIAAVAVETRTAAIASTLVKVTIAAAAVETRTAVVASTLRGLTIAAVAAETRTAVIASTLSGLTIAAVAGQPVVITAAIAVTLPVLTIVASGVETRTATIASTLQALTIAVTAPGTPTAAPVPVIQPLYGPSVGVVRLSDVALQGLQIMVVGTQAQHSVQSNTVPYQPVGVSSETPVLAGTVGRS